jgi:hypothetical protein
MSRAGMVAARLHGESLPSFSSHADAERALFLRRDRLLASLQRAAEQSSRFAFDMSPESLKKLESWYFELLERDNFRAIGLDRLTFEGCVAMYFGEVVVQNNPEFKWAVHEYAFQAGRYEIGVERPLVRLDLTRGIDLAARGKNKRRHSLWRDYHRWAG